MKAVAEIPDLVMRGACRNHPSKPSPQDNIMQFWQDGMQTSGLSNHCDDSSTVEPAGEIEVRHAVCTGS